MTSISYQVVGTPNDFNALSNYVRAFVSKNCSANLNTWDNVNYTIDVYYQNTPTDDDVQFVIDLIDAYQDPSFFISYQETQINSCQSAWSTSAMRQVLATNQIPAYIIQPMLFNASPGFVINTIKWLVEFDMSGPTLSADSLLVFDLVDITKSTKRVLRSVTLTVSDLRAASFSNDIDPSHSYKNIIFDDLALFNPSNSGIWQLEAVPGDNIRVRTVSQEILWYTIQFSINNSDPPALPVNVPPTEIYKLPSDIKPTLGSTSLTVQPPSWSAVTGPSGVNVTLEPRDPNGYPSNSQPASDVTSPTSSLDEADEDSPSSGPDSATYEPDSLPSSNPDPDSSPAESSDHAVPEPSPSETDA